MVGFFDTIDLIFPSSAYPVGNLFRQQFKKAYLFNIFKIPSENLRNNADMVIVDMDFGNIWRALRSRKVDPVCLHRSSVG